MKKNDQVELLIEDISISGEGIGHAKGMTFFVKGAIPGDLVRAGVTKQKKTYAYARVIEILTPSKDRIRPACPVAGPCGGCQLMSMDYPAQLSFKQKLVRDKLLRIGGFPADLLDRVMEPIVGLTGEDGAYRPFHFRNKAQYPVQVGREGQTCLGFYASHSHRIVETEKCMIGPSVFDQICRLVRTSPVVVPYEEETGKGLLRHVLLRRGYYSGEVMVCLVLNTEGPTKAGNKMVQSLFADLQKELGDQLVSCCVNYNRTRGNVILGRRTETFYGRPYITDSIADLQFHISAPSFYQVNSVQTERLYAKALEAAALTGKETVWDLYCGIGTISLFLARKAKKVYGVEIVPEAVENARENARLNHISNAEFFLGKAEEILPDFYGGRLSLEEPQKAAQERGLEQDSSPSDQALHPDVIVVDPPRKGCDKTCLETMLKMRPDRIVYVSCDPATLARDLKVLCQEAYELRSVTAVDQFCHSVHIECVIKLQRRDM